MSKKDEYKIDKGIYQFMIKRKCDIGQMRTILLLFGKSLKIKYDYVNRLKYYQIVSEEAQKNFNQFKNFFYSVLNEDEEEDFGGQAFNNAADDL